MPSLGPKTPQRLKAAKKDYKLAAKKVMSSSSSPPAKRRKSVNEAEANSARPAGTAQPVAYVSIREVQEY